MKIKIFIILMVFALTTVFTGTSVFSAESDYPEKSIRLMCPYSAGGTTDLAARTLSSAIPDYLGEAVAVVNKPGASGSICMDYMMDAKPDGYTMMMTAIGSNALYPAMNPNLPFDYDALTYVARTQINPNMLVVKKDRWDDFEDFEKDLKESPEEFKYATAGPGTTSHLGASILLKALGLPTKSSRPVHYNSDGEAVTAVIQGEVDFFQANLAPMDSQVKGDMVQGLAVTTKERLPDHQEVPTYKELGYPEVDVLGWRGVAGPPGLPENIVEHWEKAVKKTTGSDHWQKVVTRFGDRPGYLNSEEFTAFVKKEFKRYRTLFKELDLMKD